MLKVGLTGGLACGKSFVANELERQGAHVIHADELGHEVLLPDGAAYDAVLKRFGTEILKADGTIDRTRLADIVFNDPASLADLNAIVHPAVVAKQNELMAESGKREAEAVAVVEAAILIETGIYKDFDRIVLVTCDPSIQRQRALERAGIRPEDVEARLRRQLPTAEKLKFADDVIDTSGTKEDTLRQTRELYTRLRKLAARQHSPESLPK